MFVQIDNEGHVELVGRYRAAATDVRTARTNLRSLVSQAEDLLGTPAPQITSMLSDVARDLEFDATDLEWRGDFLIRADARLATQVAARSGELLNRFLVEEALENGWTYREAELHAEFEQLRRLPVEEQIKRWRQIRYIEETLRILEAPNTTLGITGDIDSDLSKVRVGPPLRIENPSAQGRGRDLVIRALEDTADPDIILQDEFEAILHDNGNVTLVLGGVTDLSSPDLGYNDEHRSLRDIDQEALPSSKSSLVEDNGYARRVQDWVEQQVRLGVIEPGAQTTIIGHSFGGDTALDLAADPHFNGELLNVTHAVPVAYYNEPQFADVPAHTNVLVLQNIWDVPVLAEGIGTIYHDDDEAQPADENDPVFAAERLVVEGAEEVVDGASWVIDRIVDGGEALIESEVGIEVDVPDIPHVEFQHDDIRRIEDNILLVEFEGGFTGAGHHQDNYTGFLLRSDDLAVDAFLADLDAHGFTGDGTTVSVDVTKPEPSE